mmetsp:Transcript_45583/g.98726  ORF Transcript_45583/g.98726 Transcript_45583/m.98726 type:complete len:231 (-) Transcript_45583:1195-1887(-)
MVVDVLSMAEVEAVVMPLVPAVHSVRSFGGIEEFDGFAVVAQRVGCIACDGGAVGPPAACVPRGVDAVGGGVGEDAASLLHHVVDDPVGGAAAEVEKEGLAIVFVTEGGLAAGVIGETEPAAVELSAGKAIDSNGVDGPELDGGPVGGFGRGRVVTLWDGVHGLGRGAAAKEVVLGETVGVDGLAAAREELGGQRRREEMLVADGAVAVEGARDADVRVSEGVAIAASAG